MGDFTSREKIIAWSNLIGGWVLVFAVSGFSVFKEVQSSAKHMPVYATDKEALRQAKHKIVQTHNRAFVLELNTLQSIIDELMERPTVAYVDQEISSATAGFRTEDQIASMVSAFLTEPEVQRLVEDYQTEDQVRLLLKDLQTRQDVEELTRPYQTESDVEALIDRKTVDLVTEKQVREMLDSAE